MTAKNAKGRVLRSGSFATFALSEIGAEGSADVGYTYEVDPGLVTMVTGSVSVTFIF
jgi:hypothetical protein